MSVEISQRMLSEIMPAFTEMAEMFVMKTKNSEKLALFSIKCSRGALSIGFERQSELNYFSLPLNA